MVLQSLLEKLTRREDLDGQEAAAAMQEIMDGGASEPVVAAFLIGLSMKGERPVEIAGAPLAWDVRWPLWTALKRLPSLAAAANSASLPHDGSACDSGRASTT